MEIISDLRRKKDSLRFELKVTGMENISDSRRKKDSLRFELKVTRIENISDSRQKKDSLGLQLNNRVFQQRLWMGIIRRGYANTLIQTVGHEICES
jgi:hypothetical protein